MNKTAKKNNLIQGAYIATVGILISKILGIIYVIPFNALVGEKGGALYGYAYHIFLVFIGISSAGLPLAMSKIVSEYQILGYYKTKEKAFKIGCLIAIVLGTISFLFLYFFAPFYAHTILGNVTGGNTVEDITFVIRILAIALFIVPILSVYRGYFEGHKYMSWMAVSEVLEQIVRVFVIVFGCFFLTKLLKLPLKYSIGMAVFSATVGSLSAYLFLLYKRKKNLRSFEILNVNKNEKSITSIDIVKKIAIYAFPLIMIDLFKSLYNVIDSVTVVKTMESFYNSTIAEGIYSVFSTWGSKINMIIISFSTGTMISLIPHLTSDFVAGKHHDVEKTIHKGFQALLLIVIPLTLGLSFLAFPTYTILYGNNIMGSNIMKIYVFVALANAIFITSITVLQVLKYYKMVFISLISGVLLKLLLNVFLMKNLYKLGLPAYYGIAVASIIAYSVSSFLCIFTLKIKEKISFRHSMKSVCHMFIGSILMIVIFHIVHMIVPFSNSRMINLFVLALYGLLGIVIYFGYLFFTKTLDEVYGKDFLITILKKRRIINEK